MRFIQKWSYISAKYLADKLNENHEKRSVYYYGFQIVIGGIVKTLLLVIASLLLGSLIPTLLIAFVFATLRVQAGGYHMDTYGKCIITSLGLFIIAGLIAQYTCTYWNTASLKIFVALSFVISVPVLIKWAPADTPNRPITKPEEIKKFKKLSLVYIFIWLFASLIFIYYKQNMYVIALCLGLLLEIFTITPAGYKFFDKIRGRAEHFGI